MTTEENFVCLRPWRTCDSVFFDVPCINSFTYLLTFVSQWRHLCLFCLAHRPDSQSGHWWSQVFSSLHLVCNRHCSITKHSAFQFITETWLKPNMIWPTDFHTKFFPTINTLRQNFSNWNLNTTKCVKDGMITSQWWRVFHWLHRTSTVQQTLA